MTELDELTLEDLLSADTVKCEAEHAVTPCSVTVTHRQTRTCGNASKLVCASWVEAWQTKIAAVLNPVCKHCKRSVHVCWRFDPV